MPGVYDFAGADAIVAFAEQNRMRVKGHALVWHGALPDWVKALPPSELRAAVEDHIRTVVGRYRGRIAVWDVVNEAVADGGPGLRDTVFLQKLGDSYLELAFRVAHEADPEALLTYNDYGAEGLGPKSDQVYALVRRLKERGVPIGGVGLQMHVAAQNRPPSADIAANLRRLAELGLVVNISEMDVRIKDVAGDKSTRLAVQRREYQDLVAALRGRARLPGRDLLGLHRPPLVDRRLLRRRRPPALRRSLRGQAGFLRGAGRASPEVRRIGEECLKQDEQLFGCIWCPPDLICN